MTQPANFIPTLIDQGTTATDSSTGSVDSQTLTSGGSDTTLDFGFITPEVSVGDFVWVDSNGNGVQDAGEPGIAGVTVTVTGPGGGAVTGVDGTTVGPVVTDANGRYVFTGLPALPAGQHYTTHVDNAQAALTGYVPTQTGQGTPATDSSTASSTSGDLTKNGASDLTLDFGFVQPITIGDFVWNDVNKNGVQDAGEPGIPGVTVTITNANGGPVTTPDGTPIASTTTTTDANGNYTFTGLAPGQYVVTVTPPAGYAPTQPGQGTPATDSSTGSATSGTLPSGGTDNTLDFGFIAPAVSVGDFVWADSNGNGVQGAGEPGIPGVTVTLTGPNGGAVTDINGAAVGPVTTDANGLYVFTLLPALPAGQHYTVHVDNTQAALAGYTPTQTGQGTPATDSSTGSAASGDLTADGSSDLTLDFGFVKPVSVGDYVFDDVNGDGIQQSTDLPIAGVTLTISNANGGAVLAVDGTPVTTLTTTTDANGHYEFTRLAPGQYVVTVTPPAGYVPTKAGQGTPATDSSTGSATSGTLSGGSTDLTLDFGFVRPVSVGDFVWIDSNHNGVQDAGEPGIKGVVVTITDAAGKPVTDVSGNAVTTATTDASGHYLFTDLPPGQYVVTIKPGQAVLAAYSPTLTGQGTAATDSSTGSATSMLLASGAQDLTLDFGFYLPASGGTGGESGGQPPAGGFGGSGGGTSFTGSPTEQLIGLGVVLLLLGLGVLVLARRRRA